MGSVVGQFVIPRFLVGAALVGLVIALVGCEQPSATEAIEGTWIVTEYPDAARGYDLADEHDMTLIFTKDRWVWTFDPPLPGVSEHGAAQALVGSYELLPDWRDPVHLREARGGGTRV